jgi:subtilisin family serine protease
MIRTLTRLRSLSIAAVVGTTIVVSNSAPAARAAQPPTAPQPAAPRVPQDLRNRVLRDGRARVIVELRLPAAHVPEGALGDRIAVARQRERIAAAADRVVAGLARGSHREMRRFTTVPYLVLEVTPASLAALEQMGDEVVSIAPDALNRPSLAESVPLIEADQAWSNGFDGTGMTIAILDTGVDKTHPFLTGKVVDEACYSSTTAGISQTFCPSGLDQQLGAGAATPCPLPNCEHGTHVAGIAAGGDTDPTHPFPGVAKGASLMAVQVFTQVIDPGSCGGTAPCVGAFSTDIIAALEHVYDVALLGSRQIASVNMSLGGDTFDAPCDDQPYKPIIDNLRSIGVPTVIAAGNSGWPFGITAPACISTAVSVGATDKQDNVAWFTNTAPFLSLFAPGDSITSSVPGGGYEALSGTSMATPHVAGVWAILKQAAPTAGVSTILDALQHTGLPITDTRYEIVFGTGPTIPRVRTLRALATLTPITSPAPSILSVSPAVTPAGIAATLTVTGSGFNALSTVEWNGAARTTRVVNATTLTAPITAQDVAAQGSALVTVFNPPPGGGRTAAATVTIGPPPTLTIGAAIVAPGDQETVTLARGVGGATDTLALAATSAPDGTNIQSTTVGAGVTDRTWTVTMPTSPGPYEFRLYVNGARAATSAPVTVDPTYNMRPVLTSMSPTTAVAGAGALTLTVNGSGFIAASRVRWNGADRPTTLVSSTQMTAAIAAADVAAAASALVTVFTPSPGGGTTAPLTFTIIPAPVLTVDRTTATSGATVTMTLVNGFGNSNDWLALAKVGSPATTYVQYTYVGAGVTTRTWTVTLPLVPGAYEFRYFPNNGWIAAATSPAVVIPTPVLTVDRTQAASGTPITVTLTGGSGGATAWLGFAATSASDFSSLQTVQIGAGVTTRTWTVTAPTAGGTYEFRMYADSGFTRIATSAPVTVAAAAPSIATLQPPRAVAGSAAIALTVNGAGFTSNAVVRWNGADRSTTFVSATQLRAAIPATDLAAVGTAQVSVFAATPGGGASNAVAFAITAAPVLPSLTVDQTAVVGGAPVTVTLIDGAGGTYDWLAFAPVGVPNTGYLQWTYVGAGVTTRTWTVTAPSSGGSFEFRLFADNGYTRLATSPAITVAPLAGVPSISSLQPASAVAGTGPLTLTVNGSNFTAASVVRWNGADRVTTFVAASQLRAAITAADVAAIGSAQVTVFTPAPGGGLSPPLTFPITATPPQPVLTVSQTSVVGGSAVTVTLTNGAGGSGDWLAFADVTTPNTSALQSVYVGAGVTTRTWTVTTPLSGGTFEFRLFLNNTYTRSATSPAIVVSPASTPVLSVDATTVAAGAPITVTLTQGFGGATDWIAFAPTGTGNTGYLTWTYVGAGVTTRTWTVTAPSTPGTYEFRLFLNNGFTRTATSPTVTVH